MAGIMLLHMVSIHSGVSVSACCTALFCMCSTLKTAPAALVTVATVISRWQHIKDEQTAKKWQNAVLRQVFTHKLWCKVLVYITKLVLCTPK